MLARFRNAEASAFHTATFCFDPGDATGTQGIGVSLQARKFGMEKINPTSGLFYALVLCVERRTEVLEFTNFLKWLTTKHDGSALIAKGAC